MKPKRELAEVLELALELLDKHYDQQEADCRKFKWLAHKYLPQSGDEYVKNKNVFTIGDKTVMDIQAKKFTTHRLIRKLFNGQGSELFDNVA